MFSIWNLPGFCGIHLTNYLQKFGIRTRIINNFDSEWDILCETYRNSPTPPLVGLSTTFHLAYSEIKRVAKKLREFTPDMEIVLGGAFVNAEASNRGPQAFEKPMRKYKIDYILHAFNSENNLRDLIAFRKGQLDLARVKNLAYIDNSDFESGHLAARLWHQRRVLSSQHCPGWHW